MEVFMKIGDGSVQEKVSYRVNLVSVTNIKIITNLDECLLYHMMTRDTPSINYSTI